MNSTEFLNPTGSAEIKKVVVREFRNANRPAITSSARESDSTNVPRAAGGTLARWAKGIGDLSSI